MKKTISKVLLTAVTAAVVLSACSKVPEESKYIPKEAGVVLELNAKQLTQKLVTNGLSMEKLFNAAQTKDTSITNAWNDAKNSGIDLASNFFASFIFRGDIREGKSYLSITGSLKDADKFEAYLKKNVADFSLKNKNDFKYIWDAKQHAVIGWTKSTLIYVAPLDRNKLDQLNNNGMPTLPDANGDGDVDSAAAAPAATASPAAQVTEDEAATWVAETDHLFHLKENETAGTIEPFKKLMKDPADIAVFVNPESIYNSGQFAMIPANFKKLMEGTYYTGTLNFEKGKVLFNGDTYYGKELAAIYKKFGKKEVDMDMLKKYPSENITGFLSYAIDLHVIGEIIKSTGADGLVNMGLQNAGLTMDDILNAFEGQLVYVASDFTVTKKESQYFPGEFRDEPSAKWIFNLKVGNKDAFNKVMTSPMVKQYFTKEGDHYVMANPAMAAMAPSFNITEKSVTLGSDSALLQQYLAGKGSIKLPEGVESKVKGSMMGGYLNVEQIMKNIPEDKVDSTEKSMIVKLKNLLKDATFSAQTSSGDIQHSEAVLNFKDQDKNSLVQLVEFGTEAAKMVEAKKKKEAANQALEDSLFAAPVAGADSSIAPAAAH
ncbi:hypothetical protein [Chitinophaga vietnamensis]|uniref:hypothetical protein n=1 Tax=Chitinophaga vietnamensis TaxID=2593957 RepID=UPI001177E807|nr:hypothetical protein [Chitinophaga vietnamensis]